MLACSKDLKEQHNTLALLQTLPGVDVIGAAMLRVEIGNDMSAFGQAQRLASWVGICPGNHESAGKRQSGRSRKGNPYVRRLLCEFAHAASRTPCTWQSKFQALFVRRGHNRAIIALAHKMLCIIFCMLSRGQHYRDSAIDYEALFVKRNAPRWIKALRRYGFLPAPV
jgi:transposase